MYWYYGISMEEGNVAEASWKYCEHVVDLIQNLFFLPS